jgi:hypothetical protein
MQNLQSVALSLAAGDPDVSLDGDAQTRIRNSKRIVATRLGGQPVSLSRRERSSRGDRERGRRHSRAAGQSILRQSGARDAWQNRGRAFSSVRVDSLRVHVKSRARVGRSDGIDGRLRRCRLESRARDGRRVRRSRQRCGDARTMRWSLAKERAAVFARGIRKPSSRTLRTAASRRCPRRGESSSRIAQTASS